MTLRPLEPDLVYTSVGKWGLELYVSVLFLVQPLSLRLRKWFFVCKKRGDISFFSVTFIEKIQFGGNGYEVFRGNP
jgi:thiaminase/transcriptional activator TenA